MMEIDIWGAIRLQSNNFDSLLSLNRLLFGAKGATSQAKHSTIRQLLLYTLVVALILEILVGWEFPSPLA